MALDFQYESKNLVVPAGQKGVLRIPSPDVAFLDKKYFLVSGIALSKVEVLAGCGNTNINLADFTDVTKGKLTMTANSTATDHIIQIPFPTNNLVITIDNSAGATEVSACFYGGSA